ncbi:PREDICTED: SNW domain-containing protein 1-like [Priapulus caudatus]|uniref:SNW domain-containing protein 1-like n=1 Tax=Priapulus caudatus TaxID=37621 RepID=A0ABM1E693_PRICU|nr:PREDICTED: SNW domain-containing protein 1-like [Priapulus caudatus]
MATLASLLPKPSQYAYDRDEEEKQISQQNAANMSVVSSKREPPPYLHRKGFVPRVSGDFGDGGACPEVHVAQYPMDMGLKKTTSNSLTLQYDAQGKVKYDAIARQGHEKDKVVHSKFQDLVPAEITNVEDPSLQKPTEDEVADTTEKTRQALEKLVSSKIAAALPVKAADKQVPAQYIRYTPSQQGVAFNSGAKQRVIRMVEMQSDPMEPPRFKTNKKIPRGPPSPPAPVMHSPNRKVTVKEQQEWKVPPCISNWKNAKGYTIPLDKRLAADGRGLQTVHINENFAKLAEALYIADRKAREALEMRAQLERKLAQKEKEKKEEGLRALAQKAREERAGIRHEKRGDKDDEVRERDEMRQERHKDRQRDRNLARAAPDRRSKVERQRERDVSEKIALGLPNAGTSAGETQFDQRLFNQSKGMDSGFGDDEGYNVYDKAWRTTEGMAGALYRPTKNVDKDIYGDDLDKLIKTSRFVPDKEFAGTDRTGRREGPVQFERQEEEDPFGLNKFLTEAKKASKRPGEGDDRSRDHSKRRRE